MRRRRVYPPRGDNFEIDTNDDLSPGLVFAGLGRFAGTLDYCDSAYGVTGALTSMDPATDWVSDPVLNRCALDFDGLDDYVTFGDVLGLESTDAFTISFWYRAASATPTTLQVPIGKVLTTGNLNGWCIRLRGDVAGDPWEFFLRQLGSSVLTVRFPFIADTDWHNVVATYDGSLSASGVSWWTDGVAQSPTVTFNTLVGSIATTANFNLGSRNDGASGLFAGSLADPVIIKRIIGPDERLRLSSYADPYYGGWLRPVGLSRRAYSVTAAPTGNRRRRLLLACGA